MVIDIGTVGGFQTVPATGTEELQSNGTSNAGSWISTCIGFERVVVLVEDDVLLSCFLIFNFYFL